MASSPWLCFPFPIMCCCCCRRCQRCCGPIVTKRREREAAFDSLHTCNASLCMREPPLLVYIFFFFLLCEAIEMDLARFYRFHVPLYRNNNAHRYRSRPTSCVSLLYAACARRVAVEPLVQRHFILLGLNCIFYARYNDLAVGVKDKISFTTHRIVHCRVCTKPLRQINAAAINNEV